MADDPSMAQPRATGLSPRHGADCKDGLTRPPPDASAIDQNEYASMNRRPGQGTDGMISPPAALQGACSIDRVHDTRVRTNNLLDQGPARYKTPLDATARVAIRTDHRPGLWHQAATQNDPQNDPNGAPNQGHFVFTAPGAPARAAPRSDHQPGNPVFKASGATRPPVPDCTSEGEWETCTSSENDGEDGESDGSWQDYTSEDEPNVPDHQEYTPPARRRQTPGHLNYVTAQYYKNELKDQTIANLEAIWHRDDWMAVFMPFAPYGTTHAPSPSTIDQDNPFSAIANDTESDTDSDTESDTGHISCYTPPRRVAVLQPGTVHEEETTRRRPGNPDPQQYQQYQHYSYVRLWGNRGTKAVGRPTYWGNLSTATTVSLGHACKRRRTDETGRGPSPELLAKRRPPPEPIYPAGGWTSPTSTVQRN